MNPVVTISGGGIIGNYISSRLSKNNIESLIIERSKSQNVINENIRTLTLNSFSKKLLDDLGIKVPFAPIKEISVFDGDGSGSIHFSSKEINEENLSYVVFFNDLQEKLQDHRDHQVFFENQIEEIFQDNENNCSELKLSNQEKIKTKFIAGCDGRNSNVAKIAKLNEKKSSYNQTAITFTASCEIKDEYLAHQIFSDKGIFAIMPLPENNDKSTHTIVWSVDNENLRDIEIKDYVKNNISYFEQKLSTKIDINSPTAINYEEKRPFFNKGIDALSYSLEVYYSRSINNPTFASKIFNQGRKSRLYVLSAFDEQTPYLVPTQFESYSGIGGKSFGNVLRYQNFFNSITLINTFYMR